MATDFDIVENRHGSKQGRTLESATDADRSDVGGRTAVERLAI
jgi:hypothetical protein